MFISCLHQGGSCPQSCSACQTTYWFRLRTSSDEVVRAGGRARFAGPVEETGLPKGSKHRRAPFAACIAAYDDK